MEERRIGTFTCGICLIIFGIAAILAMFTDIQVLRVLLRFWPCAIISLGLEMLVIPNLKEIKVKYDFFGCLLTTFVVTIAFAAAIASYTLEKVIFQTNFLDTIKQRIVTTEMLGK